MLRSFFGSQSIIGPIEQDSKTSRNRINDIEETQSRAIPNCSQKNRRIQSHRISQEQDLRVYYTNSRSLGNKMNELRALVCTEKLDIIAITETWINLENKHYKTEYSIIGYNLYNTDRNSGNRGGGVAVYVRDGLNSCIKSGIKSSNDSESIWVEIKDGQSNLLFGVVYRPPSLDRESSKILWDEIDRACSNSKVYIVGDFNFGGIDWEEKTGNSESSDFLEVVNDNFLYQHISEPTRCNNILDLVLSKDETSIHSIENGGHLANSDHNEIRFCIKGTLKQTDNTTIVPNFREANYEGLRDYLKEAWRNPVNGSQEGILEIESSGNRSVEQKYSNFLDVIHRGQEIYIPSKQFRSKKSDPRWLTNRLKNIIGRRRGIYRKIKRGEYQLRNQYRDLCRQVKRETRKAKRDYEIRIAEESKANPKGFYQLYRTKTRENIGSLKSPEGHIT